MKTRRPSLSRILPILAVLFGLTLIVENSQAQPIRTLGERTLIVFSLAYSPDGSRLASGGLDSAIRIWNAETGKLTRTLEGHTDWVWSIAWSPNGTRLASGATTAQYGYGTPIQATRYKRSKGIRIWSCP